MDCKLVVYGNKPETPADFWSCLQNRKPYNDVFPVNVKLYMKRVLITLQIQFHKCVAKCDQNYTKIKLFWKEFRIGFIGGISS
jgi:hypothetical protein